ncbi:MAG: TolC family protein [Bacteroidota bacterium]|nr:TolC family protein [Bacteroidota bacterium]
MRCILLSIVLSFAIGLAAQNGIDGFLRLVENNNKELLAAINLLETKKIGFRTDINPDNPKVGYGNFPGTKSDYGHKSHFSISQSFEFPTIYATKRKIADEKNTISNYEYQQFRQELLLQAKLAYYDFIFLLKKKKEISKRLQHSGQLFQSYKTGFDMGNVSVLDVNKAKIQFLKAKSNYELTKQKLQSKIKELELFIADDLQISKDTLYSNISAEILDTVLAGMHKTDPQLLWIAQNRVIAQMNIKLKKQEILPNFEISYEREYEPAASFSGFKAEISIPLWQNKNTVKLAKAQAQYAGHQAKALYIKRINEIEKLYEQKNEYGNLLQEYSKTLENAGNLRYLEKALEMGQLSIIDYFNELSFFYNSIDEYLKIEKEYYKTDARLNSFKL